MPFKDVPLAEGIRENFDKVEQLVDLAPPIEKWIFIKFKPALGPGFITNYEGTRFDPEKTIYIPLKNEDRPDQIGINVCYPELNEDNKEKYLSATFIMLDTLLGEKSVAEDIDYLNVVVTPEDIDQYNFGYLSEIANYIEQKKRPE
ncbi:hypothetical protein [Arcticibacter sp. MXS-1]|uniref:hypothetical protein n=1 Tax=Arcticibacter sp. MXS-1 TaxID=3341726 RepID=UPI0035A9A5AA